MIYPTRVDMDLYYGTLFRRLRSGQVVMRLHGTLISRKKGGQWIRTYMGLLHSCAFLYACHPCNTACLYVYHQNYINVLFKQYLYRKKFYHHHDHCPTPMPLIHTCEVLHYYMETSNAIPFCNFIIADYARICCTVPHASITSLCSL